MKTFVIYAIYLLTCLIQIGAFSSPYIKVTPSSVVLSASVTEEDIDLATAKGLVRRDRYIATNRFAVRKDQQAKFEKRWATRKSRVASLPGFRYFHLMRRVTLNDDGSCSYDGGETEEEAQENYVSFTIWDKKSDFSAWRKGDAFKEAHGGTSIGAFLTAMVGSAFVLRGPPRPAFYDALATTSVVPKDIPKAVDGWRVVDADGINTLPVECFIGMEKYFVLPEMQFTFEKFWTARESTLAKVEGFVAFSMMRRDGQAKGHGVSEISEKEPNYVGTIVFKDRASHDKWKVEHEAESMARKSSGPPPPKMWNKAPEKVYYEGTLVLSSTLGP